MDLDAYCSQFFSARKTDQFDKVARTLARSIQVEWTSLTADDILWLADRLSDASQKWFTAFVMDVSGTMPEALFAPMMKAAVYEGNPSLNRSFIEPCIRSHGYRRVNSALLDYLEAGSNQEKAGAASSLYWASVPMIVSHGEQADPAGVERAKALDAIRIEMADVWQRKRRLLLTEFVGNPDLDVRRRIIPMLNLTTTDYPPELQPLVGMAIDIARNHADDYIRHRVECQLGNEKLFRPLPPLTRLTPPTK